METNDMETNEELDLHLITTDAGTQSRAAIDENLVDEYANLMSDGVQFPSPIVYFNGSTYWLASGFHRFFAAKLAGKTSLLFVVRFGSLLEAILCSVSENQTHGLRRSNADKRAAVLLLLDRPEGARWTNQEVATCCGVTRQFVFDLRQPGAREARDAARKNRQQDAALDRSDRGSQSGETSVKVVDVSNPGPLTVNQPEPESHGPNEAELRDVILTLQEENQRLNERLAVEAMDATEEEKTAAADTIAQLRRENLVLSAERDAMSNQFSWYINQNNELKREVVRLRRKLDQIKKTR